MKVLYYRSSSGRSPVEEFIRELPSGLQEEFVEAVSMLEDGEKLEMPLSRNLAGIHPGLHELRLRDASGAYRVFYYIKVREAIFMLHAFKKKTQKTPAKELVLALRRMKEV